MFVDMWLVLGNYQKRITFRSSQQNFPSPHLFS